MDESGNAEPAIAPDTHGRGGGPGFAHGLPAPHGKRRARAGRADGIERRLDRTDGVGGCLALGILAEDAFIEREGEGGDTYEGFPGASSYNRTLDAIEEAGLDHNRERADGGKTPIRAELGLDEEPETEEEELQQILAEGGLNAIKN